MLAGAAVLLLIAVGIFAFSLFITLMSGLCEGNCPSETEYILRFSVPVGLTFFPLWAAIRLLIRWRTGGGERRGPPGWLIAAGLTLYPFAVFGLLVPLELYGDLQWGIFWTLGAIGWPLLGGFTVLRSRRV